MGWDCKIHPGCIWSLDCLCKNCKRYTKTYIDTKKSTRKKTKKSLTSDDK